MTRFHLIGIGGAGMSVVAELLARDAEVSGSDSAESAVLDRLRAEGMTVYVGQAEANVDPEAVVVVSSAIRDTNPELVVARRRGQRILHRSQALALAATGRDFVAVAGAHGKTTTSAMIATALRAAGEDPSWAIGGTVMGLGGGSHVGEGAVFVAEADESDASFLNYTPRVELVTNVEPDHLDHYGSREAFEEAFAEFARCMVPGGLLVACVDSPGAVRMAQQAISEGIRVVTYGCGAAVPGAERHVAVADYAVTDTGITGTIMGHPVRLAVVGEHNLLNAAGAWAVGVELGVDETLMAESLAHFHGTGRRFEKRGEASGITVIDDYAHHPTEIAATLAAARPVAGQGRLIVLFQPHLYSRTRNFAEEFARSLALADEVIVTGVYAAREDPMEGVEGNIITERMDGARFIADRFEAAHEVARIARSGDLVMTIGAGNVTELGPIILEDLSR